MFRGNLDAFQRGYQLPDKAATAVAGKLTFFKKNIPLTDITGHSLTRSRLHCIYEFRLYEIEVPCPCNNSLLNETPYMSKRRD